MFFAIVIGIAPFPTRTEAQAPERPLLGERPTMQGSPVLRGEPQRPGLLGAVPVTAPFGPRLSMPSLELPQPRDVFQPTNEAAFLEKLRSDAARQNVVMSFPADAPAPTDSSWTVVAPLEFRVPIVPVSHPPLYFENAKVERFRCYHPNWQPMLSSGRFVTDAILFPLRYIRTPAGARQFGAGE